MSAVPIRMAFAFILACLPLVTSAFLPERTFRRYQTRVFSSGQHGDNPDITSKAFSLSRRQLLLSGLSISLLPLKTEARGLVQFPVDDPDDLLNSYHFLRVGATLLEEEDIWSTNPLFLTNREAALSPLGQEQIQAACAQMEKANRNPGVVKFSLAASSIDSANIVADTLNIGRDRIVPEYTYLDPRGMGKWDMLSYSQTRSAVWAMDEAEAGPNGEGGRPPANTDGTPNETLKDQAIRLRQVISILETLYSGETILIIFPDSTGPALLSALIAGIPLNKAHELEFGPGELRMDVTKASVLDFLNQKPEADATNYNTVVAAGREELSRLRSTDNIISLKDQRLEAERIEIDKKYNEKEAKRLALEEAKRRQQQERALERQASTEEDTSSPLLAAGAAALIGTAGLFAAAGSDASTTKPAADRVTGEEGTEIDVPTINDGESLDSLPDLSMEKEIGSTADPVDPYEAAEKAMEEYMNRDDGAEDWLSVMSGLMDDEESSPENQAGETQANRSEGFE